MAIVIPSVKIGEAVALVVQGLNWWRQALAAAMPETLHYQVRRWRTLDVLEVNQTAIRLTRRRGDRDRVLAEASSDEAGAQELAGTIQANAIRQVTIRLAPELVMRRQVVLPLAAESRLRPILANEIDRCTPFAADQVAFDFRVSDRNRQRNELRAELAVVRLEILSEAHALAERLGLVVSAVGMVGDDADATAFDFLESRLGSSRGVRQWLNDILGIAAVILAAAWLAAIYVQRETEVAGLERELDAAKTETRLAQVLRQEIARLELGVGRLAQRRKLASPLAVLREITNRLPDEVWVYQVQIANGEARFAGYAPDASALVPVLEQSPLLHGPRFRAPVSRTGSAGAERFDLSAEVQGGPKP